MSAASPSDANGPTSTPEPASAGHLSSPAATSITFLHGLGGSPMSWENQVTTIPPGVIARAPWLRGLRPGGTESFDLAAAAGDIWMNMQLEGLGAGALVGHSLGAMVALRMAIDSPDQLSHLVLIAGQVRPPKAVMRAQRIATALIPSRSFANSGVSKHKVRQAMAAAENFDAADALGSVTTPTLVVIGAKDHANTPAARVLAAGIPDSHLVTVAGAGHDVMREAPEEFNEQLWRFLGHRD